MKGILKRKEVRRLLIAFIVGSMLFANGAVTSLAEGEQESGQLKETVQYEGLVQSEEIVQSGEIMQPEEAVGLEGIVQPEGVVQPGEAETPSAGGQLVDGVTPPPTVENDGASGNVVCPHGYPISRIGDTAGDDAEIEEDAATNACRICAVQAMIDALPDAEEITADGVEEVIAAFEAIDVAKAELTDEELGELHPARYEAATIRVMELMGEEGGMPGEEGVNPLESTSYHIPAAFWFVGKNLRDKYEEENATWDNLLAGTEHTGEASFDPATRTLTLKNVNIEMKVDEPSNYGCVVSPGEKDKFRYAVLYYKDNGDWNSDDGHALTIHLIGNNVIKLENGPDNDCEAIIVERTAAVCIEQELTLTGDGTLTLENTSTATDYAAALQVNLDFNFDMKSSGKLTAITNGNARYAYGIFNKQQLTQKTGVIESTASNSKQGGISVGIRADGRFRDAGVALIGGEMNAEGSSYGLTVESALEIGKKGVPFSGKFTAIGKTSGLGKTQFTGDIAESDPDFEIGFGLQPSVNGQATGYRAGDYITNVAQVEGGNRYYSEKGVCIEPYVPPTPPTTPDGGGNGGGGSGGNNGGGTTGGGSGTPETKPEKPIEEPTLPLTPETPIEPIVTPTPETSAKPTVTPTPETPAKPDNKLETAPENSTEPIVTPTVEKPVEAEADSVKAAAFEASVAAPPINPSAKEIPDAGYGYPTYRNETPDPNDPASPEIIVVLNNEDVPLAYRKAVDPEDESKKIYIEDSSIPLAGPSVAKKMGHWALVNLIMTIVSVFAGTYTLLKFVIGKRREEGEEEHKAALDTDSKEEKEKRHRWYILSVASAIASVIVFILTEDMRLPMIWIDRWTFLMIVLALMQVPGVFVKLRKKYEEEREKQSHYAQ